MNDADRIRTAEVVLPCDELDDTLAFFTDTLGFRLVSLSPADDPRVAVLAGHGSRLRLERGASGAPGVLRLECSHAVAAGELTAPNGTRVLMIEADAPLELPPLDPEFVVSRLVDARWVAGRAGMRYRDLVPGRQGGRFIASHIQIPGGGPVPDYVHHHRVRFQMIYCYRGWVRVLYEDQGPPLELHEGDCVLQPPGIRHRVLESSPGLEVVEVSSPAEHETFADHELELPTANLRPERDFGGQRFVRHEAAAASWSAFGWEGFEARDLGIAAATDGLAGVHVARVSGRPAAHEHEHDGEFRFAFVTRGGVTLRPAGLDAERLGAGDAFAVPAGLPHALCDATSDLELLVVSLPADAGGQLPHR